MSSSFFPLFAFLWDVTFCGIFCPVPVDSTRSSITANGNWLQESWIQYNHLHLWSTVKILSFIDKIGLCYVFSHKTQILSVILESDLRTAIPASKFNSNFIHTAKVISSDYVPAKCPVISICTFHCFAV